jgi:uncharacterized membrane protein
MTADSPIERARRNVTGIVSILVTGFWMAAMFTGQEWWLAALLVGYIVVVPLTAMLFGDEDDWEEWVDEDEFEMPTDEDSGDADTETPLESLRRRYANGELTDEQFERKLDRLLETETLEDVEEYRERASAERERELE